jgi:hypothetical protein
VVAAAPRVVSQVMMIFMGVTAAGPVEQTPIVAWLVGLAAAQRAAGQHSAEVASLQKALKYMSIPPSNTQGSDGSSGQGRDIPGTADGSKAPAPGSSSSSSSSSGGGGGGDVEPVPAAPSADAMRQRLAAQVRSWWGGWGQ